MEPRRAALVTWLLVMAVVLVPVLWLLSSYALSLAMAVILAALCSPLYVRLRERRVPPRLASAIVTLGLTVCVLGPLAWFVTTAVQETIQLVSRTSADGTLGIDRISRWIVDLPLLHRIVDDPVALRAQIDAAILALARTIGNLALQAVAQLPAIVGQAAICILAVFFLLVDGARSYEWIAGKLPLPVTIHHALAESFRSAATAVILASTAAATTQAVILLTGYLVLGIPGAFLGGFAAFLLAWVPMVGVVPVWLTGAAWLFANGQLVEGIVMLGIGCVASFSDNIVRPLVLGGRESMHPLVSLVAILGGIAAFGLVGVFLGPVIAAMALAVFRTWPTVALYCGVPLAESGRVPEIPSGNAP